MDWLLYDTGLRHERVKQGTTNMTGPPYIKFNMLHQNQAVESQTLKLLFHVSMASLHLKNYPDSSIPSRYRVYL